MITRLELKNFTTFNDVAVDFSPKINVIIGENGTGKTHFLKAAYALCSSGIAISNDNKISKKEFTEALTAKFIRLFMPIDSKLGKLHRHGAAKKAQVEAGFDNSKKLTICFNNRSRTLSTLKDADYEPYLAKPIYIPTKEVLSLVQGMNHKDHDQKTVELIFDDSYVDLSNLLIQPGHEDPETKINIDPRLGTILPMMGNLIGGRYRWENGGFRFQSGEYKEKARPRVSKSKEAQFYQDSTITQFIPTKKPLLSSSMTAEGFKKVGVLHRLLSNGACNPGISGPLFWDEPESNLNPKLIKQLVEILLELSRNGQQIILATHDYVLLKWFDLLMDKDKDDHTRFHVLYRNTESGEVKVESTDDYHKISPNAIANSFNDLTIAHAQSCLKGVHDE